MTVVDSEDAVVHLQEPEARHLAHPLGLASTVKLAMSEPPVAVGAASMTIAEVRVTVTREWRGLKTRGLHVARQQCHIPCQACMI
jgi:hypothetical protein